LCAREFASYDAVKPRVFLWLLFVVFWCRYIFVRCAEEKESYEKELTSCLHAPVCILVSHLGLSQYCLLGLALDLVRGLRIILALLWFTLLLHFLVPVASILSIFEGGCGVAESGRSRLIWLARMLGYFFGGVRIVTLPLNLRVLLPSIFASLLCIYGWSSTLPLVESFRSRSFR
jgi:hypothetical protein